MRKPKIALIYDRINKFGGAERVLEALHELYPQSPFFTAVYHPKKAAFANKWEIHPSFVNHLPFARSNHEWYFPLMPRAFASFDLSDFDIVISVTSAEAKGVITNQKQLHICYLLTPTRYLWSHTHQYMGKGVRKAILNPLFSHLRRWDFKAAQAPDQLIAISQHVSKRTKKYYRREVDKVIYPPVNTGDFTTSALTRDRDYFLIVSRLVAYKNIDVVIKAFNQLPKEKLIIVGTGKEKKKLKALAGKNIEFLGHVPEAELAMLYQQAKGFIFPQEEDFGITALEAQAAGTPVIAFKKGAALETVKDGETGIFFDTLETESLVGAISTFQSMNWYDKTIQRHARNFDKGIFLKTFSQYVEEAWEKHLKKRK